MIFNPKAFDACPLGVVLQRSPGVTPWRRWSWRASAVLPGAPEADWKEIRRDGDITEFHASTPMLELHGAETEAYQHGLAAQVPCVYVVMREGAGEAPLDIVVVTASPYEAQDYTDSGEEIVEKVPMPAALRDWIEGFVATHHEETPFVKRKRDKQRVDLVQDGVGDARISKAADIYATPARMRRRLQ
ncbi:MAG: DUF3305 domain-containing protein [Pseudomonadota bacterium]